MANFSSFVQNLLQKCNPDPTKAGNTLLILNVFAMALAGLANTFAIATDKDTTSEDKKFLIPAGFATGAANVALYCLATRKIIKALEKHADKTLAKMEGTQKYADHVLKYTKDCYNKAKGGFLGTGLFKKSDEVIKSMKETLFENGDFTKVTQKAHEIFKEDVKGGASVLGAFAGAIIGCGILTPIIRDVSAYFIQKKMEQNNPELKAKPYRPYFDPGHWKLGQNMNNIPKQPLTLENYIAFTNGSMKI
ncbi:hypothetical protein IJ670_07905 [bacterium]|nr:hypothetical protein [bacterium]